MPFILSSHKMTRVNDIRVLARKPLRQVVPVLELSVSNDEIWYVKSIAQIMASIAIGNWFCRISCDLVFFAHSLKAQESTPEQSEQLPLATSSGEVSEKVENVPSPVNQEIHQNTEELSLVEENTFIEFDYKMLL